VPKYGYKAYCPINKNDLINMTIREDEIIELFTPKEGDVVIDIGAHIGRYTIIGAKRVGTNGKVVAIEANPSNFEMLNRNIKLNRLTNIISLNNAVYSKETKIKLYLPGEELGHTTYVKIDVEGAEFEVLKGATNVLSKSKDIALLIEIHNLSGGTNLYRPIIEFLNLYNFKIEFEKSHDGGEKHIILRKHL
ncbi:MAG: putative methyltransferase FkbM family, partial [Nitrososphaeraceae archaeon]|nr:putative methyltransferase FkbM family [Nitrososphaeraceae archaeon]